MQHHTSSSVEPTGLLSRRSVIRVHQGAPRTDDHGRRSLGNSEDSSTFAANRNAANVGESDESRAPRDPLSADLARNDTAAPWAVIPRTGGLYEVSALGVVRSAVSRSEVPQFRDAQGYLLVRLSGAWGMRRERVHRLVLESFCGPPARGQQARHLDGRRTNNSVCNLSWGTPAENTADRIRHGGTVRGERKWSARLTREQVLEIRRRRDAGEKQTDVAADFPVSARTVSDIARRRRWAWLDEHYAQSAPASVGGGS